MKKLVIKTAFFTLASFLVVIIIAFLSLSVFSPKTLAKGFDKLGNHSLTVKYYEKQYQKTNGDNDLLVLCEKLDYKKDAEKSKQYLTLLLNLDNSQIFEGESSITSREFYSVELVLAIYYANGIESALEKAKEISQNSYTRTNGFNGLVCEIEDISNENLLLIKDAINQIKPSLSVQETAIANADIDLIESILGE